MGCNSSYFAQSGQAHGRCKLTFIMAQQLLISAKKLQQLLQDENCIIFDCRFNLLEPDTGFSTYLEAHIPGAVYAHLEHDLAGQLSGQSGRHPLPDIDSFADFLGRSGWCPGKLLVAYDDVGGAIAARLWWLMKYFGQENAALLDGGFPAWQAAELATEHGEIQTQAGTPAILSTRNELVASTAELVEGLGRKNITLVDARARARFAGETEPIDAVAGHIPGAVNYPFSLNLDAADKFRTPAVIRNGLADLNAGCETAERVHMCGSGVTACHNLFATELAGLPAARLYVGSWSEWIQDPSRPVSTAPAF